MIVTSHFVIATYVVTTPPVSLTHATSTTTSVSVPVNSMVQRATSKTRTFAFPIVIRVMVGNAYGHRTIESACVNTEGLVEAVCKVYVVVVSAAVVT